MSPYCRNFTTVSAAAIAAATPGIAESIDSAAWDLIGAIEVTEIATATTYEVRKVFPAEIQNGVERFDITGFAVPLSMDGDVSELIIVSDMGFCPFCGDPEHGKALQVSLVTPIPMFEDGTRLTLRGSLETIDDPQTWQSALMRDAVVVDG